MAKSVTEQYSELMHYTTSAGLFGIISSGCLWATHASFLNDAEEIVHFLDSRLPHIAREESLAALRWHEARNPAAQAAIEREGLETLVDGQALEVVSKLRSAVLGLNQPYVFSLCAAENERTERDGLLSQWRGYGSDGGYAIVFDTDGLDQLLKEEGTENHYQHLRWGDVFYYDIAAAEQAASEEIAEAESILRLFILTSLRDEHPIEDPDLYGAITTLSCFYKHGGFKEEKEVRVVAIPVEENIARQTRIEGESRPAKLAKSFLRGGVLVPYIELLRNSVKTQSGRLPIKRVIVGPHRDNFLRKQAVEIFLESNGYQTEVVISSIPYIGR